MATHRRQWTLMVAALLATGCESAVIGPELEITGAPVVPNLSTLPGSIFLAFGPALFEQVGPGPVSESVAVTIPDIERFEQPMRLVVVNGPQGTHRVPGAHVRLNGVELLQPGDLTRSVFYVEKEVILSGTDLLEVEFAAEPGAAVQVLVEGFGRVHLRESFDDGDYTADPTWDVVLPGIGVPFLEIAEGAFHYRRTGAGGSGWWIYLLMEGLEIAVTPYTEVSFDGVVVFNTVPDGCGFGCSEWTVEVRVLVEEADGNLVEIVYGLNDDGGFDQRTYRPDGSLAAVFVGGATPPGTPGSATRPIASGTTWRPRPGSYA